MVCSNCGKENPDGSKFCAYCGTQSDSTSAENNVGTTVNSVPPVNNYNSYGTTGYGSTVNGAGNYNATNYNQNYSANGYIPGNNSVNTGSNPIKYSGDIFHKCFGGIKDIQKMFYITVLSLVINVILMFCDMIDVFGYSCSFYKLSKEYSGISDNVKLVSDSIIVLAIITILAIVLMFVPIFSGKLYKRRWLALNIPSMVLNFLFYGLAIVSVLAESNRYGISAVSALAYIYLIETIASQIITIVFLSKLKLVKSLQTQNYPMVQ